MDKICEDLRMSLSGIDEYVHSLGMEQAKKEQDKILKRHNLLSLNKEQIDGVGSLIREVNKIHKENLKQAIKELKEKLYREDYNGDKMKIPKSWELIDRIFGEGLL